MTTGIPYEQSRRVSRRELGGRQTRRPNMRFNLITKPYQVQPACIMPVLPGETLSHALLQAQVWSDPLAAGMKNIGWWCEYFGFYVAHQDLTGWDVTGNLGFDLTGMMVNNSSLASYQNASGNAWTYCYPGAIDYVLECTKACVGAFFRDEGEQWNDYVVDSVPLAKLYATGTSDWSDKLTLNANYQDRHVAMPSSVGPLVDEAWEQWLALKDAGLVAMDYDDWMRTYGTEAPIQAPNQPGFHKPELLFHLREFDYPINTVDPVSGNPATAMGWRIKGEGRKRAHFQRPGWIIMFNCIRPKMYLGNQLGSIAGAMQDRMSWLPAVLDHRQDLGNHEFTRATGPLKATITADEYWIDLRDMLTYGDQFFNYGTAGAVTTGVPFAALPASNAVRRYASATQIMALFSDAVNGRFRQDGVLSLSIATHNKQVPGQLLTLGHSTS